MLWDPFRCAVNVYSAAYNVSAASTLTQLYILGMTLRCPHLSSLRGNHEKIWSNNGFHQTKACTKKYGSLSPFTLSLFPSKPWPCEGLGLL